MYLLIINPRSGGGAGQRTWQAVEGMLHSRGIPHEPLFTQNADRAETQVLGALARRDDWRAAIVIGGDGTIHSVLGALRRRGVPLAVIPAYPAMTRHAASASRCPQRPRWRLRCRTVASKPICSRERAASP